MTWWLMTTEIDSNLFMTRRLMTSGIDSKSFMTWLMTRITKTLNLTWHGYWSPLTIIEINMHHFMLYYCYVLPYLVQIHPWFWLLLPVQRFPGLSSALAVKTLFCRICLYSAAWPFGGNLIPNAHHLSIALVINLSDFKLDSLVDCSASFLISAKNPSTSCSIS